MFANLIMLSTVLSMNGHLPPLMPWQGKSLQLMQSSGPLTTDFELSGGEASPIYEDTMKFVDRLIAANPTQFSSLIIGESFGGRAIKMIVASENGQFSANMIKSNGKPTILIQAGIHSGEIDGKDAGFMLLRDIATGKRRDLLTKVNILFIPILNVDGHERRSEFNRINQRGPIEMGFRTNGNNLNLNRDYTKLDTPEVKGVLNVINEFEPDLYVDVHVTDGADYQYDVTYGYTPAFASESPQIATVLAEKFQPHIDKVLADSEHIPGPLVFVMDKREFKSGLAGWIAGPRFSNGWGDLANVPTILVENHSLKPYKQRVLGTYVFLDGAIDALSIHGKALESAVKNEHKTPKRLVLNRKYATEPDFINFKGIKYKRFNSALSGQQEVKYLGEPEYYEKLPIFWKKEVVSEVDVPDAFYIPQSYSFITDKLSIHGINVEKVTSTELVSDLNLATVKNYSFDKTPFEGRFRVTAEFGYDVIEAKDLRGWYKVSTHQARGKLATHLLHPEAPDSFFSWGSFHTIFQRTEYVENYALVPYARSMLKDNPKLALEFDKKLREDKNFESDPKARLNWLYSKTPYYDQGYLKYPILMQYKPKQQEVEK
ncbi:M14 family metallopeptidase [Pseudoalteromonas phenolica]|uniref:M14 family metallopeptidase n=1 Tax=Pseudoalteromonas phenolica TaxID=161398 RepID=UPI00110B2653|nr:M14 family metallopeptidase [Pseudoalteromonas phenolica]TMO56694.1 peptidase M14 [Pseudoalteromonas phenolica]